MALKSDSSKAAEALAQAVNQRDWVPSLFIGVIMAQPPVIQRHVIDLVVQLIETYLRHARHPYLDYRTDPQATDMAEAVDLTDLDHG